MRQRLAFLLAGLAILFSGVEGPGSRVEWRGSRSSSRFSEENAWAHIRMLAGRVGSRPTGTDANARAREYVVEQLRRRSFEVRIQDAEGLRPQHGATAHVANVIAVKRGALGDAIALVSHYDSVPDGPGAADAALGVAVCLEAGRALTEARQPRHTLVILLTDGEELGLMGATAALRDPIRNRIRAVLNFEAVGSAGPALLFEVANASRPLVDAWAQAAPHPAGASFMLDIYRRLPNDTDLSIFRRAGIAGINFAPAGDSYAYHTIHDNVSRLDRYTVHQMGENAVATVEALDARDLSDERASSPFYFDVARAKAIVYGRNAALVLFGAGLLFALLGWIQALSVARRIAGLLRVVMTAVLTVVCAAASVGAMCLAASVLRATRESYHPWYAHPGRFFLFEILAAALGAWVIVRIGSSIARRFPRLSGSTHPSVAWSLILPFWACLAAAAQIFAPNSAYLAVLPLAAGGLSVAVLSANSRLGVCIGAVLVLAVAGTLWLPSAAALLRLTVAEFGGLPLVTPLFVYPALLFVCGLFVVPPLLVLAAALRTAEAGDAPSADAVARRSKQRFSGARRRIRPTTALAEAVVLACGWCWFTPAYTHDRPLRQHVRYVNDLAAGQSYWETAANEPAAVLTADPAVVGGWRPASAADLGTPIDRLRSPFVYRARSGITEPPPLAVSGSLNCGPAECEAGIVAVPTRGGTVAMFELPRGVAAIETSLPIAAEKGRVRAIYAAVPASGVNFRARITRADAEAVRSATRVVAVTMGVPGGSWPALPGWLPQEHAVWQARSYFVIPVPFAR